MSAHTYTHFEEESDESSPRAIHGFSTSPFSPLRERSPPPPQAPHCVLALGMLSQLLRTSSDVSDLTALLSGDEGVPGREPGEDGCASDSAREEQELQAQRSSPIDVPSTCYFTDRGMIEARAMLHQARIYHRCQLERAEGY